MKVTVDEIIDALRSAESHLDASNREWLLAERIKTHGIAPPDGEKVYVCRDCRGVYLEPNVTCDCLGVSGYDRGVIVMLSAAPKQEFA